MSKMGATRIRFAIDSNGSRVMKADLVDLQVTGIELLDDIDNDKASPVVFHYKQVIFSQIAV